MACWGWKNMGESILHLEDEPFMGENAPKSMRAHVRESFALVKTVFVHWLCCWSHFSEGNHPEILKKHKSNPKKSQGNPKTFTKESNFWQILNKLFRNQENFCEIKNHWWILVVLVLVFLLLLLFVVIILVLLIIVVNFFEKKNTLTY